MQGRIEGGNQVTSNQLFLTKQNIAPPPPPTLRLKPPDVSLIFLIQ